MPAFRVDAAGFSAGECDRTRIVPGAGLRTDFDEFVTDADTEALWHLHDGGCEGEGLGLADASGNGHLLTNHGAEAVEDGYHFLRSRTDYVAVDIGSQPARGALTLESWVRAWDVPVGSYAQLFRLVGDNGDLLNIEVLLNADNTATFRSYYGVAATLSGFVQWTSSAAQSLLAGTDAWHVAVAVQAPNWLRLFVNGVLRAEDTSDIVAMRAGTYVVYLGHTAPEGALSAVLDEVRLSSVARYSAGFSPRRLRASGQYSGPTFDSGRAGARWVGIEGETSAAQGTQVTWEARAADLTDALGRPQAEWQPYAGPPAVLPHGRFLQWRATLSASPDGRIGPTVAAATAQSSENGYNLYHATGPSADSLVYDEPYLRVGPGVQGVLTPPLAAGAVHWIGIRPVNADDVESPVTGGELRLELAASGEQVADRPAGVLDLTALPVAGGRIDLAWRWRTGLNGIAPEVFQVFSDGGSGTVNYAAPIGEVPYEAACVWYRWASESLPDGGACLLAVRAVAAVDLLDEQPAVVSAIPDSSAPGEVGEVQAEVLL
jgi:hypothetical protein